MKKLLIVSLLMLMLFASCSKDAPTAPAPVYYKLYVSCQEHVTWQYAGNTQGITNVIGTGQGLTTVNLPTNLTADRYCFHVWVTSQSDSAEFKINDEPWTVVRWNVMGTAVQICGNK